MGRATGGAVLMAATAALAGAVILGAVRDGADEPASALEAVPPQRVANTADAAGLLAAVAGTPPVACDLVVRALGNRWGGGMVRARVHEPLAPPEETRALARWAWTEAPTPREGARLMEALASRDACQRRVAAALLGRVADDATRAAIRERAERGTGPERLAAIAALGGRREAASVRTLHGLLSETDPELRRAAVWGLGSLEAVDAIDAVVRALRDQDVAVRENAAWALGRMERSQGVQPLVGALRDPAPGVRINAAWALGAIESTAAIPALTATLTGDADPEVRMAAAWALGHIDD